MKPGTSQLFCVVVYNKPGDDLLESPFVFHIMAATSAEAVSRADIILADDCNYSDDEIESFESLAIPVIDSEIYH
jgi:hypothetical protein